MGSQSLSHWTTRLVVSLEVRNSFYLAESKLYAHETMTPVPTPPPPNSQMTTIPLSVSVNQTTLSILYEWNHNICSFVSGLFH